METNQNELKRLSKDELIEMINMYKEKLTVIEECGDLLRLDSFKKSFSI